MDSLMRDLLRRDASLLQMPRDDWERLSRRLWPAQAGQQTHTLRLVSPSSRRSNERTAH